MNIVHVTGVWVTNIGNGIIDYGARNILLRAFPDANVQYIFEDNIEYIKYMDIDIVSFGGACLGQGLESSLDVFLELKKINPKLKILIQGAGGWRYDKSEIQTVCNFLTLVKPEMVITREDYTYECYKDYCRCFDGIDCGFFAGDTFTPFKINKKYILITDGVEQSFVRDIEGDNIEIIDVSHKFMYNHKGVFQADFLESYFRIYFSAQKVYSNRFHGGVLACAYNIPTRLMLSRADKRSGIFDKVECQSLFQELGMPNKEKILEMKDRQVCLVKNNL